MPRANSMKDFAGTELEVGQEVALTLPYYKHLVKGRVEKIGEKMVTCSYDGPWGKDNKTPRYPNQVMVIGVAKTDKDKLTSLLDDWKVPYEDDEEGTNTIILEADAWKNDAPVTGYGGFVTHVTFDENGGFRQIGIWE